MLHTPVPVERQASTRNSIERGPGHIFDSLPGGIAPLEGRLPHLSIRILHKRPALRNRQALPAPVGKFHIEFQLARYGLVEPAPGVNSIHPQICRQYFLCRAHGPLRFPSQAVDEMGATRQGGTLHETLKIRLIDLLDRPQ